VIYGKRPAAAAMVEYYQATCVSCRVESGEWRPGENSKERKRKSALYC